MGGEESLDLFLAQLRGAGEVDSEGGFSIDLRKAIARLDSIQIARPDLYFRHLVAAGIASAATWVRVQTRGRRVCIEHDGQPLSFETMQEIFPSLFMSPLKARAYLRELAVGLHGARMAGLTSLVLESWSGGEGARLQVAGCRLEIRPLKTQPKWQNAGATCSVTLKDPRALMDYLFVNPYAPKEPDWRQLRYAAVPIEVNGSLCNALPTLEDPVLVVALRGTDGTLPEVPLDEQVQSARVDLPISGYLYLDQSPRVRLQGIGPLDLQLGGHLYLEGGPGSTIHIVIHGIDYPCRMDLQLPGSAGLIYCNEVLRDASLSGVVQNEFFETLRQRLARELARAIVRLAQTTDNSALVDCFRQAVAGLVEPDEVSQQSGIQAFDTSSGPRSLRELAASYQQHRFLVAGDGSDYRPPFSALVVAVDDWCRHLLETRFAGWVDIRTLRLLYAGSEPRDEPLAGVPFAFAHQLGTVFAHLRLPATPFLRPARLLLVSKGQVIKQSWLAGQPRGLELVFEVGAHRQVAIEGFLHQVLSQVDHLYQLLLESHHDLSEVAQEHVLAFLATRSGRLDEYQELVSRVSIRFDEARVGLAEILSGQNWAYTCTDSEGALRLTAFQLVCLRELMPSGTLVSVDPVEILPESGQVDSGYFIPFP
ncbi:MAG: hypothetical protein AB7S38_08835 [Vulcanimicrobiota bacterium]